MSDHGYETNNRRSSFVPFLLGAAAGAAAGFLLAPTSGKELRERIADGADRTRKDVTDFAERTSEAASTRAREVADRARGAAEETRAAAQKRQKALEEAIREGKEAYERALERAG